MGASFGFTFLPVGNGEGVVRFVTTLTISRSSAALWTSGWLVASPVPGALESPFLACHTSCP